MFDDDPLNQAYFVMFDDVFGEDLERVLVRGIYLGKLGKEFSLYYSRNENNYIFSKNVQEL